MLGPFAAGVAAVRFRVRRVKCIGASERSATRTRRGHFASARPDGDDFGLPYSRAASSTSATIRGIGDEGRKSASRARARFGDVARELSRLPSVGRVTPACVLVRGLWEVSGYPQGIGAIFWGSLTIEHSQWMPYFHHPESADQEIFGKRRHRSNGKEFRTEAGIASTEVWDLPDAGRSTGGLDGGQSAPAGTQRNDLHADRSGKTQGLRRRRRPSP